MTVRLSGRDGWERFRDWCGTHQFNCVHIMLARGEHVDQPMATWRRSQASLSAVLAEATNVAAKLQKANCAVVRVKAEADLSNHDVPRHDEDVPGHAATQYFEHHVKLLRNCDAPCDRLLQVCGEHNSHLSRNARRELARGKEERFVTLRHYRLGSVSSLRELAVFLHSLKKLGEQVIEVESEYCVFDSNLDLDRGWLTSELP